ncbi:MAG: glycerophosphodiester phosphodiesterase [Oscillospiraceae bacterium]|nr:glycerophosphodiester phosphodiesterase [Oscillospiraceae bacterium]
MTEMTVLLLIAVFLVFLFLLSQKGRSGHEGLSALRGWNYAHRGLHSEGKPENSMAAFRAALEHGYGIEFDVHLMKDGNLAVIHDSSLRRTAGADVRIEDLSAGELSNYPLEGTVEVIPTFQQVLELCSSKAPMIIELKSVAGNFVQLSKAVCDALDGYSGSYCIESFDPRCVRWLRLNRPDVIRGQLAENFLKSKASKLPFLLKLAMTLNLPNFYTRPDFVAYKFSDRKNLSVWLCRKIWRIQGVTWTLRDPRDHLTAVTEDWIPIFEHYNP